MARLLALALGASGGAKASLSLACNQPATRQFDAEAYRCVSQCVANNASFALVQSHLGTRSVEW